MSPAGCRAGRGFKWSPPSIRQPRTPRTTSGTGEEWIDGHAAASSQYGQSMDDPRGDAHDRRLGRLLDAFRAGLGAGRQRAGAGRFAETLDLLPLAFTRPLTGAGSRAMLIELLHSHGPDSFIGNTASIMMGSSETTFYVLTIYSGAVNIKKIRHTLAACLLADLVGVVIAIGLGYLLFGTREERTRRGMELVEPKT